MDWHDFLRAERARKLKSIEMLSTGRTKIEVNRKDVSEATAAEQREHVIEIETLLTAAGEPFDA